jgi:lysophospholipase L1-like esterase
MRLAASHRIRLLFGLVSVSSALALYFMELVLRVTTSELDLLRDSEQAFWQARLREQGRRSPIEARDGDTEYDCRLGWRMRRSYWAAGIQHDERGFRRSERAPAAGARRALFIGDSFTYGLGVRDETTFAARFGELSGYEAINAGVNAYGADQALLMWELEGRLLEPDLVVFGYVVDDFLRSALWLRDAPKPHFALDDATGEYSLRGIPVPRAAELSEEQLGERRIRVLDAGRLLFHRARRKLGIPEPALAAKAHLSEYILERLRDSVEESGARLLVLVIGRHRNADEDWIHTSILASCTRLGVACLDVATEMRSGALDAYFGEHEHFSPLGHRFIAERILEAELRRDRWPESGEASLRSGPRAAALYRGSSQAILPQPDGCP